MPVRTDYANLVLKKVVEHLKVAMNEAGNINKGQPLGMEPKSTKQQIEDWVNMTEQDKMAYLQKVGYQTFIDHAMDMEEKMQRSDNAVKAHYGIKEGL